MNSAPPQVVSKVGGTIDDSEMVDGMVFDQKVCARARWVWRVRVTTAMLGKARLPSEPPRVVLARSVGFCVGRGPPRHTHLHLAHRFVFVNTPASCPRPLAPQAAKSAGGPTRMENATIALIQFQISPPKTDIENNVIVSDYNQVRGKCVLTKSTERVIL